MIKRIRDLKPTDCRILFIPCLGADLLEQKTRLPRLHDFDMLQCTQGQCELVDEDCVHHVVVGSWPVDNVIGTAHLPRGNLLEIQWLKWILRSTNCKQTIPNRLILDSLPEVPSLSCAAACLWVGSLMQISVLGLGSQRTGPTSD